MKITGKNGYYEGTDTTFTIAKEPAVIKLKKVSLKVACGSKNFALGASVNSKVKKVKVKK